MLRAAGIRIVPLVRDMGVEDYATPSAFGTTLTDAKGMNRMLRQT